MDSKRFYFVRHGQTSLDTLDVVDCPLNSRGRIEAEQVGWYLKSLMTKGSKILVLSSMSKRAIDTASPFIKMLESDRHHYRFALVNKLQCDKCDTEDEQFWNRICEIPDILRDMSKDFDCVVVFSHGTFLSCLFRYLISQETLALNSKIPEKISHCSVTIFDQQSPQDWKIVRYNTIDHLDYDD